MTLCELADKVDAIGHLSKVYVQGPNFCWHYSMRNQNQQHLSTSSPGECYNKDQKGTSQVEGVTQRVLISSHSSTIPSLQCTDLHT